MYRVTQHRNAEIHPTAWVEAGATILPGCIIGPGAYIGAHATLGEGVHVVGGTVEGHVGAGTRIWRGAHVMAGAFIGKHSMLGQGVFVADGAIIGDRCRIQNNTDISRNSAIGDDVYVGAGVRFCNSVHPSASSDDVLLAITVGAGASIGSNVCLVGQVTIGRNAVVGAGAVVTRSVAPGRTVVGVPARLVGEAGSVEYPRYQDFLPEGLR